MPLACGSDRVQNPFGPGAGGAGGETSGQGDGGLSLNVDAGTQVDLTLGGPCEDDGQCNDRVDCTEDHCDLELMRCRFVPQAAFCDNGIYCDGVERCDVRDGCVSGDVIACSDNTTCTIDVCVEATQSCRHEPRDADGDGDPTRNCGGQDCDDTNALVSSQASEVCANGRDDNCDGVVDEAGCAAPEHDTCATALDITQSGYYDVDFAATALDYPTACTFGEAYRDVVLQVTVPSGGPVDVDVTAKLGGGNISLAATRSCGEPASECETSSTPPVGGSVTRLLLRGVEQGTYPLYLAADNEGTAQVHVELRPHEKQLGDLCEDAVWLEASGPSVPLRLPGYAVDAESGCEPSSGDAFVAFELKDPSDVTLIAESSNGLGLPVIALFDERCKHEQTCRVSQPGRLFVRDLEPGNYRVLVASTGPDDVSVRLETGPVSEAPPGEGCDDAQPLSNGVEQIVDLSTHEDAVFPRCLVGAPDSAFEFSIEGTRDVGLIGRFSAGDVGAISFANTSCTDNAACAVGTGTVRSVLHGVSRGTHRAVIESASGNPVGISWFERPPLAEVSVPFADDCSGIVKIPEVGGRFRGNTRNAFPDFNAGCDEGGQDEGGAPDQILELDLSARRRVILDMQGSSYKTTLSVRQGDFCPGAELPRACAAGYLRSGGITLPDPVRSYLDLDLQAGRYFVQIDGFDGDAGAWQLEVFTAER